MLYKVLSFIAIFLCGTPLLGQAQTVSPLVVETVSHSVVPTTVRTGEPIVQLYKIAYINSKRWDKEIIVREDDMRPKSLPIPADDFEIIGWSMGEPVINQGEETNEVDRYMRVVLRLVNKKKGAYKIPKFQVLWAIKIGDKVEDQEPMETEEVVVNYVTTYASDEFIDVRDSLNLGDYSGEANFFWWLSRVGAPSIILIPLLALVNYLRLFRRPKSEQSVGKNIVEGGPEYVLSKSISFDRAYADLMRDIKYEDKAYSVLDGLSLSAILKIEEKLANGISAVLRARLEKLNPGDTPREIASYIDKNLKAGVYKNSLMLLQQKLAAYHSDLESGDATAFRGDSFLAETKTLKDALRLLKKRWRIVRFFKRSP